MESKALMQRDINATNRRDNEIINHPIKARIYSTLNTSTKEIPVIYTRYSSICIEIINTVTVSVHIHR